MPSSSPSMMSPDSAGRGELIHNVASLFGCHLESSHLVGAGLGAGVTICITGCVVG